MDRVSSLFLDLTYKTEFNLRQLWTQVTKNISEDKVRYPNMYL